MAAADKARFFLEQSLPELREYERKGIFSSSEILAISKRRTDLEQRINASGVSASDFTRYAAYEMNVESLYRKRSQRLGVRTRLHFGARRIFFVFQRATRRFPGDVALWMEYIAFARREKAQNVVAAALAKALRLLPGKPELWVFAAAEAVERGDVPEARSHLQRALRFNAKSRMLWIEYAKLEMGFVAKVMARRMVLGIDTVEEGGQGGQGGQRGEEGDQRGSEAGDDLLLLPTVTPSDLLPSPSNPDPSLDTAALSTPSTNPALTGALATAIFDQATKEIPNDLRFTLDFHALFLRFPHLPCCTNILSRVISHLQTIAPTDPEVLWASAHLPIVGVSPTSVEFPAKLGEVLAKVSEALERCNGRGVLYERCAACFVEMLLEEEGMDEGVRKVLVARTMGMFRRAQGEGVGTAPLYRSWIRLLEWRGKGEEVKRVQRVAAERFPEELR